MMGSRATAWVCAWAALAVVSCGKSEGGAAPIPRADLPSRVASLVCESMAGCCKSSGFPLDAAACKAARIAELRRDIAENEQHTRYDAEAAGDCLAAAASTIACGEVDEDIPACQRIFVGSLALGQPCNSSRECAPVAGRSIDCVGEDEASPSVCTASPRTSWPHGKAGDACLGTCFEKDSCDGGDAVAPSPVPGADPEPQAVSAICYRSDGLFCDVGRCAPLLALGEACDTSDACRADAFCNFDTKLCTAPQPDGASCEGGDECQSHRCADAPGGPTVAVAGVCVAATQVTAEQCENAASTEPPPEGTPTADATDPAPNPGTP